MTQRVFVKVTGFTDVERHALNTVFRLSEQRGIIYSLWDSAAPEPPKLALVDGQSAEARLELEAPRNSLLKLIWVGRRRPPTRGASSSGPCHGPMWSRPWTSGFVPPEAIDFDLEFDEARGLLAPRRPNAR